MSKMLILVIMMQVVSLSLHAQEKVRKPAYVIVLNKKIITREELDGFAKEGKVKSMNKGVTQAERDSLRSMLGDVIGDKEFIIKIDLRTEEELADQKRIASKVNSDKGETEKEFVLNLNDKASNFTVKMLDGSEVTLADLRGKVVLVNFWATWCAPCLMEFSEIPEKILSRFKGDDFIFIPIAIGQKAEVVSQKMVELKKYGVNFNVGIDPDSKIWNQYAQGSIPKNFLIDKTGIIRYISKGYSEESLSKLVEEIRKVVPE